MKWKQPRYKEGQWKRWFAWYPVRIDNDTMVWLQWVERKEVYTQFEFETYYRQLS